MEPVKIGVVSCSGEDCLGGTISRLATRKILERIRLGEGVTICLPLFIAGGGEERQFAVNHPTITVEGCSKICAKRATEKFSAPVSDMVQVGEIIGEDVARGKNISSRNLTAAHLAMVDQVAEAIRIKFDRIGELARKEAE